MNSILKVNAFIGPNQLGNPAAVIVSEQSMDTQTCQIIAAKNQLPVTAFIWKQDDTFFIRWFTPLSELSLCGHGTLAAAYVIFQKSLTTRSEITFNSPHCGELKAKLKENIIFLNFPAKPITRIKCPDNLVEGLAGIKPRSVYETKDRLVVILAKSQEVKEITPQVEILKTLSYPGIVVTARGEQVDFVSRTFYPQKPNWEDAVTGASHCALVPYWAALLEKDSLHAHQLSQRGGELFCVNQPNRVLIGGRASWAKIT
ncbi:PhzF family phenazine biosynthesis protein [Legionella micdadei]|uniref:Phenazine biosynthesis protein PhzF family n=1 Tax=Legionella micdadei TaxID=451 RepID=A0A098GEM2_LEGMI|nr:PhzF family phenazine biosynthesis isomerase [Legionella micdadei]ARG97523.1 hypothetical protein B6N58_07500 [Legionella micdadei]KTD27596.1 phenazine biosynthesis PhzF [Legionella micdadei]CEG60919.1 Phenazine biosynthesis protein PhzF family [Legionella micdadei]SCY17222.1 phenazine biosynthesis protein PhzF family [Legionella micdadei]